MYKYEKRNSEKSKKIDTIFLYTTGSRYLYKCDCTSRNFSAMRRVGTLVNYLLTGLHRVEKYHPNTSVKRGVLNIFKGEASKCPLEQKKNDNVSVLNLISTLRSTLYCVHCTYFTVPGVLGDSNPPGQKKTRTLKTLRQFL